MGATTGRRIELALDFCSLKRPSSVDAERDGRRVSSYHSVRTCRIRWWS
jgi:hypothetical protein